MKPRSLIFVGSGITSAGVIAALLLIFTLPQSCTQTVVDGCVIEPNTECLARNLSGVNLKEADLNHATIRLVDMRRADLSFANLEGADLSFSSMWGAHMKGVQASGARLSNASLPGANLEDAELNNSQLTWVFAAGANMKGVDLSGASMVATYLENSDLRGAKLAGAFMPAANLDEVQAKGIDLRGSQFLFGSAWAAELSDTNATRANFTWADFWRANLRRANLRGVDMSFANLQGAFLEGADLSGVTWNETICPDGTWSDENDGETCEGHLNPVPWDATLRSSWETRRNNARPAHLSRPSTHLHQRNSAPQAKPHTTHTPSSQGSRVVRPKTPSTGPSFQFVE